jgi:hypothetical protein
MAQPTDFQKFFKNLDFSEVCAHARHYHGATPSEILGISWIYDQSGKNFSQLASALRREYGKYAVQSECYEDSPPDPLEVLEAAEGLGARVAAEARAEVLLGDVDSARLAAHLRVGRRRAQQRIAARRAQLRAAATGRGQLELALADAGVRP